MRKSLVYFCLFVLLFVFVFRSLIFNIHTNLIDWRDYVLVTWLINRNIDRIVSLNFSGFSNLNIFYPNTNTLFFSETLLSQSILGLPARLLSSNPVVVFNFVFITTFLLNYLSLYLFWGKVFKNHFVSFLGSLFFIFSPYFFLEIGHFQMLSYWPFFFSLYFFLKSFSENKKVWSVISGLFVSLQFLASTYLAIFLMFTLSLYSFIEFLSKKKRQETIKKYFLVIVSFALISGVFIKGYLDTKKQYSIVRNPNEFIQYSAHVSDYLFTTPIQSIIHKSPVMDIWNHFDKNTMGGKAAFPGFTVALLAMGAIFVSTNKDKRGVFFGLLLLLGMIFSWGPRINFNGNYAHIPSLYYFPLKLIPFMEAARAPARWSFLFYIGTTYFALTTINKVLKYRHAKYLITLISVAFLLEHIPTNFTTHKENYLPPQYKAIELYCRKSPTALLEVPITHFDGNGGILMGLNRVVKYELSSLSHKCNLINGYSGYDLPSLMVFKDNFYQALNKKDPATLIKFLAKNKVDLVKINRDNLSEEDLANYLYLYPMLVKNGDIQAIDEDLWLVNLSLTPQ